MRFAALVSIAVATGCTLLSGAADLEIAGDDTTNGIPREETSSPEASPTADAMTPSIDASVDAASTDAAVFDAAPLPPSRLRYITFETGMATGAFGVDEVTGTSTVAGVPPLSGGHSLRLDTGSARVSFPPRNEIWISVLFARAAPGDLVTMQLGGGQTATIIVVDGGNGRLAVRARVQNSTIGTSAAVVEPNKVARLGMHLKQGMFGDGAFEAWVVNGNAKFAQNFTNFGTIPFFGAFERIDFGELSPQAPSGLVVDDIQVDDASMPPP